MTWLETSWRDDAILGESVTRGGSQRQRTTRMNSKQHIKTVISNGTIEGNRSR